MNLYPVAPLLDVARRGQPWHTNGSCVCGGERVPGSDCVSFAQVAERLGVSKASVQKWVERGRMLPWWQADRLAVRLGSHIDIVWPELRETA